ncbi:serine acetyltransferase [Salmonella enterica subsp. enterica serovar Alachua]|nr:serine acetyltransferase [Salmonella enterica subsp. enterica serovar Alachua]
MPYFKICLFLLTENVTELFQFWERELLRSKYPFSWLRVIKEYRKAKKKSQLNSLFWFWWRLANQMYMSNKHIYKLAAKRLHFRLVSVFNIDVMLGATIGYSPRVHHFSNITISKFAVIGDNISIKQGVTIGVKTIDAPAYHLHIGNNVDIGANACIISNNISIGDNVTIGSMSFVNKHIQNNSIVYDKKQNHIVQKSCHPNPYCDHN